MPLVSAYQCPRTKTLFPDLRSYRAYLRVRARDSLDARRAKRIRDDLEAKVRPLWMSSSLEEIEQWCIENSETIFWYIYGEHQPYQIRNHEAAVRASRKFQITSLTFTLRYQDRCSNTHNAPVGGVTNWGGKDDLPKGYPGFYGKFRMKATNDPFGFNLLNYLRLRTGCASGDLRGNCNGDVTLFADDWPMLAIAHKFREAEAS